MHLASNANLSNLTISQGTLTPAFTPGVTDYTDAVPNSVTSVTVTPTAADAGSSITVNGAPVTSGTPSGSIALSVGLNTITIIVTAPSSATKTYTILVTRGGNGNTWYVSTTGNDSNDGTTPATAWRHMQHANDTSAVHDGDVINVLAGDYTEYVEVTKSLRWYGPNKDISPNNSGTPRMAEAVLHASLNAVPPHIPNAKTVFEIRTSGTTVEVKGMKLMDGHPIHDGHMHRSAGAPQNINVLFEKNVVTSGHNLFAGTLSRWSNVVVRDNAFTNINFVANSSSAIQFHDAVTTISGPHVATMNVVVEDNVINNTEFAGVLLDNIANALVRRNKLSNLKGEAGIQLAGGMGNATITMNEISNANTASTAGADDGGIKIYGSAFTGTINITNNLVTNSLNGFVVKSR